MGDDSLSKPSKSVPVVARRPDGTVYCQHRIPKEHEDDPDRPTLGSLQYLAKLTKRETARRKRIRGEA